MSGASVSPVSPTPKQPAAAASQLAELLQDLATAQIELSLSGSQQLRLQAPRGALTASLQARIREQKTALIAQLRPRELGPARPIQQRLWFLQQLEPHSARYHEASLLRLKGQIPARHELEHVFQHLHNRHPALRTAFVQQQGQLLRRLNRPLEDNLQIEEAALNGNDKDSRTQLLQAAITRPFDLSAGSLWRVLWLPISKPSDRPGAAAEAPTEALLLCVFHHLIADAGAAGILVQEALALLRGESLPDLPPVSEAVALTPQPAAIQPPVFSAAEAEALPLPRCEGVWQPGQPVPTEAESVRCPLPPALLETLQQACRQQAVSPFIWLLTAWQCFLQRYWRLPGTLLATPLSERHSAASAQQVDCHINTLLLPSPAAADFATALQQTQAQIQQALEVGFDFTQSVQNLNPARTLPFFPQLGAVMQPRLPISSGHADWSLLVEPVPWQAAKFELLLSWFTAGSRPAHTHPEAEQLELAWPRGWYQAQTMQTLLQHFLHYWQQSILQPETPLQALPLMPTADRLQLLQRWAPTATHRTAPTHLQHFVERVAAHSPTQVALRWQDTSISYETLNRRANHWSHVLINHLGVQPGDRIALSCPVAPEMLVGMLAILKAGAAYVPLEPGTPPQRRSLILQDAAVQLCLQAEADSAQDAGLTICTFKALEQQAAAQTESGAKWDQPPCLPPEQSDPQTQTAYIIYTSGSSGIPNGVPITHANVTRLFQAAADKMAFDPQAVWLLFHSFAFDYSVWEIWGAFYAGARLVLLPRAAVSLPGSVWQCILAEGVSELSQTPSAFRLLARELKQNPELAQSLQAQLPLRRIIFSGEKLETRWLRDWWQRFGPRVELVNAYGITETTVFVTWYRLTAADIARDQSPIGQPLSDLGLALLDSQGEPVPDGLPGEICVWGAGLSPGYLQRPELNARRFVAHVLSPRLYRSGDQAVVRQGQLQYLRRLDQQVQLRAYRIECGEVEQALEALPEIAAAHVRVLTADPERLAGDELVAAVQVHPAFASTAQALEPAWRQALAQRLPAPMIPGRIVVMPAFPLTSNGKIDSESLAAALAAQAPAVQTSPAAPAQQGLNSGSLQQTEDQLARILARLLQRPDLPREASFFDLGAHSLLLVEAREAIQQELGLELELVTLFQYPSVRQLATALGAETPQQRAAPATTTVPAGQMPQAVQSPSEAIAIIGMSARFPGAPDLAAYWALLQQGASGLRRWSQAELLAAGVSPQVLADPDYVPVSGWCEDIDQFDASYFGISALEARWLDPQQRLMLTLAVAALEHGGYGNFALPQSVGVFASAGISRYLLEHLLPHYQQEEARNQTPALSPMQVLVANDKDYLATRVAYHLNLTGPAMAVQTGCSSSLLAVHLACESLRRGEAELALAGGVNLDTRRRGYHYQAGGIYAQDGVCRPFDAAGTGIVGGSGGGWVLLKPLRAAQQAGDSIYAVIEGSASNNDGAARAGFLAPGVQGQQAVIEQALQRAGVSPEQIGYCEAHGTGTRIGDPIELRALRQAWQSQHPALPRHSCALGSVKGNIGHLDAAAGIASLLKVALMLHHRQQVPTLNVRQVNPALQLSDSPFYLATPASIKAQPVWQERLRAAVSSLGVGGTNVHLLCRAHEDCSTPPAAQHSTPAVLLPLSAPSAAGLKQLRQHWQTLLEQTPAPSAQQQAAWAWTLQQGRRAQAYRQALRLSTAPWSEPFTPPPENPVPASPAPIVFVCPGLGSQDPEGLRALYQHNATFREAFETCFSALSERLGPDTAAALKARLLPAQAESLWASDRASDWAADPVGMQPVIFILGWCLAQVWQALGVRPRAVIGHSFGELLAACLGGMVPLADALQWVYQRGQSFARLPAAAVLAVAADPETLPPTGRGPFAHVHLATRNAPDRFSLSGPQAELEAWLQAAQATAPPEQALIAHWLPIAHGVHHPDLQALQSELSAAAARCDWQAPRLPVWSCLLQNWHPSVPEPSYWAEQALAPLDFRPAPAAVVQTLKTSPDDPAPLIIELSLRPQLLGLFQHAGCTGLKPSPQEQGWMAWLSQVARLWEHGQSLNWSILHPHCVSPTPCRVPLPLTPLAPRQHWIPAASNRDITPAKPDALQRQERSQWLQTQIWKPLPRLPASNQVDQTETPWRILTLPDCPDQASSLRQWDQLCHEILPALRHQPPGLLICLSPPLAQVTGQAALQPWLALLRAWAQTLPQEYPGWRVLWCEGAAWPEPAALLQQVHYLQQTGQSAPFMQLAWYGHQFWQPDWAVLPQPQTAAFKTGGVYLITGASGGLAQAFAHYLRQHYQARLLLLSRHSETLTASWSDADSLIVRGDISCLADVSTALQQGLQRFGRLDGILHTAGHAAEGRLAELRSENLKALLAAKAQGCENLAEALQALSLPSDQAPDFVMLCSALAAALPTAAQSAYAAGNAFCDAFAAAQNRVPQTPRTRWLSIAWGHWRETGLARRLQDQLPAALRSPYGAYLQLGLKTAEGCAMLEAALQQGVASLAVQPVALSNLQRWQARLFNGKLPSEGQLPPEGSQQHPVISAAPAQASAALYPLVREVWARHLGQIPGDQERFSELGGDSLAALQVKAVLENEAGLPVPLNLLLEDLPLADFIKRLQASAPILPAPETQTSELLVPLNSGQTPPFYLVHAISGTVFPFQHLARQLQRQLVGVQAQGLSQGQPQTDIEAMARSYCRAIESRSAPPYSIGGWSFGALVAFAMARHWLARGLAVEQLVLLDMQAPHPQHGLQLDTTALRQRFEADLSALGLTADSASASGQGFRERLYQLFSAHVQASQSFRPSVLELPAHLLVAEAEPHHAAHQGAGQQALPDDLGWRAYLPRLRVSRIPGDHYSCLHPDQVLAWKDFLE